MLNANCSILFVRKHWSFDINMTILSLFKKTNKTCYTLIFQCNMRTSVALLNTLSSNIIHVLSNYSEQVKHSGKNIIKVKEWEKNLTKFKLVVHLTFSHYSLNACLLWKNRPKKKPSVITLIWLIFHVSLPFHGRRWTSICTLVIVPIKSPFTANLCFC